MSDFMNKFIQTIILVLLAINVFSQAENDGAPSLVVERPQRADIPAADKFLGLYKDEEIMALVDNAPVKFVDIKFWYKNMLDNHINLYPELPLTEEITRDYRKTCIEKGILKQVLAAEISRKGFMPSEEEVDTALKQYKLKFPCEV